VLLFYRRGEATAAGPSLSEDPVAWLMGRIHKFDSHMFNGRGFDGLRHAVVDYEPVLGLLSVVGLAVLLARAARSGRRGMSDRVRDILVLVAYPITHVVAFGLYQDTFQRFLIPVIPWMCLLAAIGLASAARSIGRLAGSNRPRRIVTAMVLVIALAPQAWVALRIVHLRLAPDTLTRAAAWIQANVDREHERVAVVPTLDLPLIRPLALLPLRRIHGPLNFSPWTDHQLALAPEERDPLAWSLFQVPLFNQRLRDEMASDPDAFVRALDAQYLLIDVTHGFRHGILDVLREGARRQGRLVARFGSREPASEEDLPILYELNGPYAADEHFAWRAARFTSQGPDVEIYALPR
jgi:hypothetical protein